MKPHFTTPELVLLALLAGFLASLPASAAAGAPPAAAPPLPTVLLHLSDTHFSANAAKYWRAFGDREGDMALFTSDVVPMLAPSAVVVTGDLTDGKTAAGKGLQQEAEWAAYRAMVDNLTRSSSNDCQGGSTGSSWVLPEEAVLDVRGNHDDFNLALRGGPSDFWPTYSAEGRRSGPRRRVFLHTLFSHQQRQSLQAGSSRGGRSGDCAGTVAARRQGRGSHRPDSSAAPANGRFWAAAAAMRHLLGLAPGTALPAAEAAPAAGQAAGAAPASSSALDPQALRQGACPAAWLLGIDASPEPGLLNPSNFVGLVRPALLAEVEAALRSIAMQQPAACGRPTIIAYGHYPLSTLGRPVDSFNLAAVLCHALRSPDSMQGVAELLAAHNVSAYLNGHLHGAFGPRLHRMHPTPAGGYMAELETAAWKDDRRFRLLALDPGSSSSQNGRSSTGIIGASSAGIGSAAAAPSLSFADLYFHAPGTPQRERGIDAAGARDPAWLARREARGWGITPADASASVLDYIVLVTSPPDGRYSPVGPPANPQQQQAAEPVLEEGAGHAVRALLFPLDPAAATAAAAAAGAGQGGGFAVRLEVSLLDDTPLATTPMALAEGQEEQLAAAAAGGLGPLLFHSSPSINISCGSSSAASLLCAEGGLLAATRVHLQVVAGWGSNSSSASPRQPAALRCTTAGSSPEQQHLQCVVSARLPGGAVMPLDVSWLEWLTLAVSWPVVVHRMFLAAWGLQVGGMLLLPRLLHRRWAPVLAASPLFYATSKSAAAGAAPAAKAAAALARAALAWAVWPVAALLLLPGAPAVWAALVGYSTYLLVGPWLVADSLPSHPQAAAHRGIWFHFGLLGRFGEPGLPEALPGGWQYIGTPDTMFVSLLHMLMCILPLTLWVATVVGRHQLQHLRQQRHRAAPAVQEGQGLAAAGSSGNSSAWLFSVPQLLALAALFAFHASTAYYRSVLLMGPWSVLLSPGLGWTIPAAVLLVAVGGSRSSAGSRAARHCRTE